MSKPAFAVERFQDVYDELLPLLRTHYDEISLHKHQGYDLNPNVALYRNAQDSDQLLMMIGRLDGRIVAYFVAFVRPSIHYQGCLEAVSDIFYVEPSMRGAMFGIEMFKSVEMEMRRRGVKCIMPGEKIAYPAAPLLERMGYEPMERKWIKWL